MVSAAFLALTLSI